MVRDQPLCYGDKTANKSVSSDKVHGEDGLEGLPADIAILESPFIDTEKHAQSSGNEFTICRKTGFW